MFADPIKNLKQFGLRENMIVADLGAGTGFYALAAARLVPLGKVYAVEMVKDYIATVRNRAKEAHLHNLECYQGDVEKKGGTKLRDGLADAIICSNILSQTDNREGFLAEVKRILSPAGKIMLVEWTNGLSSIGPHQERLVSKEKALDLFKRGGFVLEREIDAGSHHYGMILKRK